MVSRKKEVKDEFPLPEKCNLAFKAPDGWHKCHLPKGHKGNHESMKWVHEAGEPLYHDANNEAKPIQFERK